VGVCQSLGGLVLGSQEAVLFEKRTKNFFRIDESFLVLLRPARVQKRSAALA
jgi:hypothetical protein